MVSVLIFLAAGMALPGRGPVSGRGIARHSPRQALPPAAIIATFPVLTAGFIILGIDVASMIALVMVAAVVVWRIRRNRELRRGRRRTRALAAVLGLCIGNLRAGVSMADALDYALANTPPVAGVTDVLTASARRARSGGAGPAVLIDAPVTDLQRLGTVWEVSEKHGVPLVRLMEQMRTRLDTRERHRQASAAQLQGPQATAVILALLPLAGIVMGTAMGADPVGLLTGGGIGGVLLVVGVAFGASGFIMTQKILEGATPS